MAVKNRISASRKLHEKMSKALLPKLEQIAKNIERDAKRRCPVDTGELRKTIRVWVVKSTGDIHGTAGSEDVNYAGYVEYGTRRMKAQPFLRPAFHRELRKKR